MKIEHGTFCPLIKKDCVKLACSWFTQLRGKNPQTGADMDEWGCAVALLPLLQIEVAKEVRQGAAATESFRNAVIGPRAPVSELPPTTQGMLPPE